MHRLGKHLAARAIAVAALCIPIVTPAAADEPARGSGWEFTVAPYLWGASLKGDVGAFGAPASSVDAGFTDILERLDMGAMVIGTARKGRFGLGLDLFYVDLSTNSTQTPGPAYDSASVTSETFFATPTVQYRVAEETDGTHLDLLAGVRVWSGRTKLSLTGGTLAGRTIKDEATWVDPVIGARGQLALNDKWKLAGWALGGGAGAGSDFMWDLYAGANYTFREGISVSFGYRSTGTDYSEDGFVFDISQHGPAIGLVFRF